MSRFVAASLMAAVSLTFAGCGDRDLNYKKVEVDELKRELNDLEAQLVACQARSVASDMQGMGEERHTTKGQTQVLEHGMTVGSRPMETYITIPGSVLFKPGSARLTTEAKSALARVLELIKEEYSNDFIRVDGFTDNEPVTRSKDKWDDNFDLSGGRALAVLHFLEAHGIPQKNLGFAGFGQERPKASNTTESSRARNRRVEIVVSPKTGSESNTLDEAPAESTDAVPSPTHSKRHHHATHHTSTTPSSRVGPGSSTDATSTP